jgi:hypothetical protein
VSATVAGPALEIVSGFTTAPSTTLTALTTSSADSLAVRNFAIGKRAWLLNAWAFTRTSGILRVRSPKLHDNVQGIRLRHVASTPVPLLEQFYPQLLFPQDTLTVEMTGSATAATIEAVSMLLYYEALPGISGRFIDEPALKSRMKNIVGQEVAVTGGTGGGYTAGVAINTTFDNFKANTDYAILGAKNDANVPSIAINGADLGNLNVGLPGYNAQHDETRNWFLWLTRLYGLPLIPVFNAANKASIFVKQLTNENSQTDNVTLILAELG